MFGARVVGIMQGAAMSPTEAVKSLRHWALPKTISGTIMCDAADCIETLCAAIATPEVYAGVITPVLEAERDRAIQELREAREELAKFPEAMKELKEQA